MRTRFPEQITFGRRAIKFCTVLTAIMLYGRIRAAEPDRPGSYEPNPLVIAQTTPRAVIVGEVTPGPAASGALSGSRVSDEIKAMESEKPKSYEPNPLKDPQPTPKQRSIMRKVTRTPSGQAAPSEPTGSSGVGVLS